MWREPIDRIARWPAVHFVVLGSLLFAFRKASAKTLIRWAVALYIIQVALIFIFAGFIAMGAAFAPEEMAIEAENMAEMGAEAYAVYSSGSFVDTVIARSTEWANSIFFMLLLQGWGAMAFFLFGLAAVRNDTVAEPKAKFWQTSRRVYLPIGLIIGAAGALILIPSEAIARRKRGKR